MTLIGKEKRFIEYIKKQLLSGSKLFLLHPDGTMKSIGIKKDDTTRD